MLRAGGKERKDRGLIPIDYFVLVYSLLTTTLLLISDYALEKRAAWIAFSLCAIIGVLVIQRIDPHTSTVAVRMIRRLYPLALFTFFYEQTQSLVHVFFPGWFDSSVAALEAAILGVQPALVLESVYSAWLNELIVACYVSYYIWLPTALIVFWLRGRESSADRLLMTSTIAFFTSYTVFYLFPVEGPRYYFAEQITRQLDGFIFVPIVHSIMEHAAVHGGAMPSSHTAVALIVLVAVYRESRKWGVALTIPAIGIAVGCVWGRFHYLLDVIAGILLGILAICAAEQIIWKNLLGVRHLKGIS